MCIRVCVCVFVRIGVYTRGSGPGPRRRTTTRATLCLVRRNPSRHSSRLAPGDRLNRGSSSCALSSLGSAIRPTSDTLDGTRRRPATLGTRSASSLSRYTRGGPRSVYTDGDAYSDTDTGEITRSLMPLSRSQLSSETRCEVRDS